MKDDQLYVLHISECIARVERYTQGGEDEFFRDEKDAGCRGAEVNWRQIAGFRNVVVHDYLGLNMRTVWEIVTGDLPELKSHIAAMLGS